MHVLLLLIYYKSITLAGPKPVRGTACQLVALTRACVTVRDRVTEKSKTCRRPVRRASRV